MSPLALVDSLTPVSLDELNDRAALTTRKDRKYLVPLHVLPAVLDAIAPLCRVLDIDGRREFGYDTVYYDSPELRSFLDTARRRPRRHKIRTRRYLDSGRNWFEVKQRSRRGITVKHRFEYTADGHVFGEDQRAIVDDLLGEEIASSGLAEQLTTRFARTTLLVGDVARLSIDREVDFSLPSGAHRTLRPVIVETKTTGKPSEVDRLLWRNRVRPAKVSKYGTGLASLRPDLPRNRWARLLRSDMWAT